MRRNTPPPWSRGTAYSLILRTDVIFTPVSFSALTAIKDLIGWYLPALSSFFLSPPFLQILNSFDSRNTDTCFSAKCSRPVAGSITIRTETYSGILAFKICKNLPKKGRGRKGRKSSGTHLFLYIHGNAKEYPSSMVYRDRLLPRQTHRWYLHTRPIQGTDETSKKIKQYRDLPCGLSSHRRDVLATRKGLCKARRPQTQVTPPGNDRHQRQRALVRTKEWGYRSLSSIQRHCVPCLARTTRMRSHHFCALRPQGLFFPTVWKQGLPTSAPPPTSLKITHTT